MELEKVFGRPAATCQANVRISAILLAAQALAAREAGFETAAGYVMEKNAGLYQRLRSVSSQNQCASDREEASSPAKRGRIEEGASEA